jgi:4-hydroxybutyrate CoA-transferase
MEALVRRKDELRDVRIWQGLNIGEASYAAPECAGSFIVSSVFVGKNNRACVREGRGKYTPMSFSDEPAALRGGFVPCDVWMGTVSPPDDMGYCTFGVSTDFARSAVESAKYAIALVNPNMPTTCGDTQVHVSEINCFVEADPPLYRAAKADDSDETVDRIGKNIAALIEDGDTVQMGLGSMPNAILRYLMDKKDLGVHTEVFSDNLIPLIEAGIITGAKKKLNPRKIVTTFMLGTEALYKFVHKNDMIHLMPVNYTNHVGVIAQLDHIVAINAALEVDLMGQVASDSVGNLQFSGVGGQLDFIRGAGAAEHGKPVIALRSTAKNGTVSRISALLKQGTPVTTTRNDVRWVVTEYGAVNLFGKSLDERAKGLIAIAHPRFREGLEKEFWEAMRVYR